MAQPVQEGATGGTPQSLLWVVWVLALAEAPLARSSWAKPQQHLGRSMARLPMA